MLLIQTSDSPEEMKAAVESAGLKLDEASTERAGDTAGEPEPEGEAVASEPETQTGDTAGEGEGEPATAPEPAANEQVPQKRKPGSQVQKEKNLLLQAELDRLKQENAQLKQKSAGDTAGEKKPPAAQAKPKPKWEDFADAEDQQAAYTEALVDWKADQREAERAAQVAQQQDVQARKAVDDNWKAAQDRAREKHDDYDATLEGAHVFNGIMSMLLMERADGGELAYLLAKNPEEALKIAHASNVPENPSPDAIRKAQLIAVEGFARLQARSEANASTAARQSAPPAQEVVPSKTAPRPPAKANGAAPASSGAIDYDAIARSNSPLRNYRAAAKRHGA